jgi:hypothetical protein
MAATADRSRFTTEKVDIDHDCQAIAANSQGLIGKSSNFFLFVHSPSYFYFTSATTHMLKQIIFFEFEKKKDRNSGEGGEGG